jgi:hypothetical protein
MLLSSQAVALVAGTALAMLTANISRKISTKQITHGKRHASDIQKFFTPKYVKREIIIICKL